MVAVAYPIPGFTPRTQSLRGPTGIGTNGQALLSDGAGGTLFGDSVITTRNLWRDVSAFATGGDGSEADPWTGWTDGADLCGEVPAENTTYLFPAGHYSFATFPTIDSPGIALIGEAGTILTHTGTGPAIKIYPPSGNTTVNGSGATNPEVGTHWIIGIQVRSMLLRGNANTTDGFDCVGLICAHFSDVRVVNVATAGFRLRACVGNVFDNVAVTSRWTGYTAMSPEPQYGVYLDRRGTADLTTCTTFRNLFAEEVSSYGVYLADSGSYGTQLINGTSEGNGGGIYAGTATNFIADNFDMEANSGPDIYATAARLYMRNCIAVSSAGEGADNIQLVNGTRVNIEGGQYYGVEVGNGSYIDARDADVRGVGPLGAWGLAIAGQELSLTPEASFRNCVNAGSTNQALPEVMGPGGYYTSSLTGASSTPRLYYRQFLKTLDANWTVNAPTEGVLANQGHELIFVVTQDATGGRTIAWNATYTGPGGRVPRNSLSPNATDVFVFRFYSHNFQFNLVSAFIADAPGGLYPVLVSASETIALSSGANSIAHGLGYAPSRVVVRPLSGITIYEHAAPDATNVYLTASGAGNAKIHVA